MVLRGSLASSGRVSTMPDRPDTPSLSSAQREDGCDLCVADRYTHWYSEDDVCWVADCEICATPMVVWRAHGVEPTEPEIEHMLARLGAAADVRYGNGAWRFDRVMRQIPDHFHAHARVSGWSEARWSAPMSLYTGVGGERQTR